jgi:hypothetical protein
VVLLARDGHHDDRAAPTPTTTPEPSQSATPGTGFAGTWWGVYSGPDDARFTVHWSQFGRRLLIGSISLSNPPRTEAVRGALNGHAISFHTSGPDRIVFVGTVAGQSMFGSYSRGGSAGGSWSAATSP